MVFFGNYIFVPRVILFKSYKKGSRLVRPCRKISPFSLVFQTGHWTDVSYASFFFPSHLLCSYHFACFLLPACIISSASAQHGFSWTDSKLLISKLIARKRCLHWLAATSCITVCVKYSKENTLWSRLEVKSVNCVRFANGPRYCFLLTMIGNSEEPKRTNLSCIWEPSKWNPSTLQCCCQLNP